MPIVVKVLVPLMIVGAKREEGTAAAY